MPTYKWECQKCNAIFEEFKSMSEKDNTNCPKCKSKKIEIIVQPVGHVLKGTGWFKDSYANKKK